MALAVDCSNYSSSLTGDALAAWKAAGVALVIVQCFPPSYTAKYQQQVAQMRACQAAGLTVDGYIYDYLAAPDWRDGCLDGLTQAAGQGLTPRRLWLDEEDVTPEAHALTAGQVTDAIAATLAAALSWSTDHQVPQQPGIYSGRWWWQPMTGDSPRFASLPLWTAEYDGQPDAGRVTLYGGWAAAALKQYAGGTALGGVAGIDLSALAASEVAALQPAPAPATPAPDPQQAKIDGMVGAIAYLADDLGDQLQRIAAEMERVRAEFVGPRPGA